MKYLYYPGCSQETSALEYNVSTLAVLDVLGVEIEEIQDWTCCGASTGPVVSDLLGIVLPARNLALAEQADGSSDLLAVCSACYTNFRRTNAVIAATPTVRDKINQALEVEDLSYQGTVQVRHLLDVLANDLGPQTISDHVQRPLTGLTVAPYYGCQTVRPYSPFDDDQRPSSMIGILEALGATVLRHAHEASCCGTALPMTKMDVGIHMVSTVLDACSQADCVAVVCPMCHMNLDSYQDKASRAVGHSLNLPILFLPQLIGLAFGLSERELLLQRHIVPTKPVLERIKAQALP